MIHCVLRASLIADCAARVQFDAAVLLQVCLPLQVPFP